MINNTKENTVIDVKGLRKSFSGRPAVIDVSLQIKKGQIFGFLGPNGSGKTTTMRMLCGLLTPDAGSGRCFGYDIFKDSHEIKQYVGYMPQTFSLYQDLTVKENLDFIARIYREKNTRNSVSAMIERLNLQKYRDTLAGKLSGGWKQRVSLAAALIHHPKILLLDEPTAGVDPKARRDFWNDIHALSREGMAVLVSTHYIDEAERCHMLAYIVYGHLLVKGTLNEVIHHRGLNTWVVTGKNLENLVELLSHASDVQQMSVLGNSLRVSSANPFFAQKDLRFSAWQWKKVDASLEEVFIHLVNQSRDKS